MLMEGLEGHDGAKRVSDDRGRPQAKRIRYDLVLRGYLADRTSVLRAEADAAIRDAYAAMSASGSSTGSAVATCPWHPG